MMRVVLLAVLCGALALLQPAEVRMNIEQLRAFVSSSRKLGHSDKQIADYLKNIKLTERLDGSTVEDLGAGPKTSEVLRRLIDTSKSLPAAAPPPRRRPLRPQYRRQAPLSRLECWMRLGPMLAITRRIFRTLYVRR